MEFIEKYTHDAIGYNPFLIRPGWQVAKLNPLPGHGMQEIDKVEAHNLTDEVFVLIHGQAVLIAADILQEGIDFYSLVMLPGVVYNIPAGVWHNIAMEEGAEIIIVENDNTHLKDCAYMQLNADQQTELREMIGQLLKEAM